MDLTFFDGEIDSFQYFFLANAGVEICYFEQLSLRVIVLTAISYPLPVSCVSCLLSATCYQQNGTAPHSALLAAGSP